MKYRITIPCLVALMAVLPGCGKSEVAPALVQSIVDQPNCPSGQDRFWSELYRQVEERGSLPDASEVGSEIRGLARTSEQGDALAAAYSSIAREIRFLSREEALIRLAEMEIGDRTSDDKIARQDEVEGALKRALETSVAVQGLCPMPTPVPTPVPSGTPTPGPTPVPTPTGAADPVTLFEGWRTTVTGTLYGAYKAFSVAYQSCNAVAISPLTTASGSVSGITVTGEHSSGTGLTREVTDASSVFATNPYYSGRRSPASGCFSATTAPLIYDYGGKPYATSLAGSSIDLFKNAGSGTSTLGIDCSGFITSAVLIGGLRLKQNVTSKALQSGGVNAAMFANPAGNGLTCFGRLASTKTENLKSGDIIANSGHVVMVDKAGSDPFGIATAKTSADCDGVAAARFSFTIIQSSPSKGGIGLNRFRAADYLAGSSSMRAGLEAYARSFCRVRLGLDSPTTLADSSKAVVVRHLGGSACNDSRIPLAGESCLKTCDSFSPTTLAKASN